MLRLRAFEEKVLRKSELWKNGFVVWGAGRDGKDFLKALSPELKAMCKCMVDVDEKKINAKFYFNAEENLKVRILPFEILLKNDESEKVKQKITKEVACRPNRGKKIDPGFDSDVDYQSLPVVVCVAMYRTGGKLEENVKSIERTEGEDFWHFC